MVSDSCETRIPCSKQTREILNRHKQVEENWNQLLRRLAFSVDPPDNFEEERRKWKYDNAQSGDDPTPTRARPRKAKPDREVSSGTTVATDCGESDDGRPAPDDNGLGSSDPTDPRADEPDEDELPCWTDLDEWY